MTSNINNTHNTTEESTRDMTKQNITLDDILDMLADKVVERMGGGVTEDKPATAKAKSKAKAEPEPDEDEGDDEATGEFDAKARTAELSKMRITSLRKIAIGLEFEEDEVKDAAKDELIENIVEAEAEDAGNEDEPVNEDDDDAADEAEEAEEEGDEDEPDYESMSLTDVKKEAKAAGYTTADLKGLDKDAIIDLLMEEGDEESEEDEDEAEGDEEWYTEEELDDMSLAELKAICKNNDIKVPRGATQDSLTALILEAGEEE